MRFPPLCRCLDEERDLYVASIPPTVGFVLLSETRHPKTALGLQATEPWKFQTGGRMTNRFSGIKVHQGSIEGAAQDAAAKMQRIKRNLARKS
jgi:hypothetical protein